MLGLRSSQDHPQFKNGTVYRQVRPNQTGQNQEPLRLDSGLPSIEFPSAPALSSLFREVVSYSPSCRHKDRLEFDQPSAATTYSGVTVARRLGSGLLLRVPGAVCKGLVSLGPEL